MPTKFQLITELYDQTVQSVTGSYQSWTGFLRAACYNYKCPFDDQILIYAQRPDATAVLEMERWNRQFGRWVNRGAKSIAVFGDDGQNCLKLYFDVSDTHASRFSRPLPIWTMHPAFEPEVIETLEATFGNLAEKENLADAVRSACHNAVADNFTDYLQDLRDCREDSLLEELDDLNLEAFYRGALEVSVAYMLMTRLGLRADDHTRSGTLTPSLISCANAKCSSRRTRSTVFSSATIWIADWPYILTSAILTRRRNIRNSLRAALVSTVAVAVPDTSTRKHQKGWSMSATIISRNMIPAI